MKARKKPSAEATAAALALNAARMRKMTPEERREVARLGGLARARRLREAKAAQVEAESEVA